jgi:hypothetical protein
MAVTPLFPLTLILHSLPVCVGNIEVIRGTVCPGWGVAMSGPIKTGTWNSVKLVIKSLGTQPFPPAVWYTCTRLHGVPTCNTMMTSQQKTESYTDGETSGVITFIPSSITTGESVSTIFTAIILFL